MLAPYTVPANDRLLQLKQEQKDQAALRRLDAFSAVLLADAGLSASVCTLSLAAPSSRMPASKAYQPRV